MIYDEKYFEGGAPGGYDAYGKTAYHMQSADDKAAGLIKGLEITGPTLVIGCAYGFLVEALVKQGVNAYGLDISSYALSRAPLEISSRLVHGNAAFPDGYWRVRELAKVEMFSHIISENMFCCLTDEEAQYFHILTVFFGYQTTHLVEDRPALKQWYNYKPADELAFLFSHPNVTFEIQV